LHKNTYSDIISWLAVIPQDPCLDDKSETGSP
jgi:hypothetical protein